MSGQKESESHMKVLDEIIEAAVELPVESQDLLLMIAKAMRHTRNCVMKECAVEQCLKDQKNKLP